MKPSERCLSLGGGVQVPCSHSRKPVHHPPCLQLACLPGPRIWVHVQATLPRSEQGSTRLQYDMEVDRGHIYIHTYVHTHIPSYVSIYLFICLSIYLSICLYLICPSTCLSISTYLSIYLSACLSVYIPIIYLSISICIHKKYIRTRVCRAL